MRVYHELSKSSCRVCATLANNEDFFIRRIILILASFFLSLYIYLLCFPTENFTPTLMAYFPPYHTLRRFVGLLDKA